MENEAMKLLTNGPLTGPNLCEMKGILLLSSSIIFQRLQKVRSKYRVGRLAHVLSWTTFY